MLEAGCNGRESYFGKDMKLRIKLSENTDFSEVSEVLCAANLSFKASFLLQSFTLLTS